jgi:hypothetical protein
MEHDNPQMIRLTKVKDGEALFIRVSSIQALTQNGEGTSDKGAHAYPRHTAVSVEEPGVWHVVEEAKDIHKTLKRMRNNTPGIPQFRVSPVLIAGLAVVSVTWSTLLASHVSTHDAILHGVFVFSVGFVCSLVTLLSD